MTDRLTQRLNQILPRITSSEFLSGTGIGNEIAFHIFDYPPEAELRVRRHIELVLEHIHRQKPDLKVMHVNLFDFLIDYLASACCSSRRSRNSEPRGVAWLKAIKGVASEEKLATPFATKSCVTARLGPDVRCRFVVPDPSHAQAIE